MIRVAFASSNGVDIDAHFGWAQYFYVYDIDKNLQLFKSTINTHTQANKEHENLDNKIATLEGIDIIYSVQMGPTASKKVLQKGMYSIQASQNQTIDEAINKLQVLMRDMPPLWLMRIMHKGENRGSENNQ